MPFDCRTGASFYAPKYRIYKEPHLWVILTEPSSDPQKTIIVSVTTKRSYSDTTVILGPGDHPFIRHQSVISYSDAKIAFVDKIQLAIVNDDAEEREPFDIEIVNKIRDGILESSLTPKKVQQFYRDWLRENINVS